MLFRVKGSNGTRCTLRGKGYNMNSGAKELRQEKREAIRAAQQSREKERYQKLVEERAPKSNTLGMCVRAFLVGGLICCIGQLIHDFGNLLLDLDEKELSSFTAIVLVFLGATLTGIGVYDKIGSFAGAGSVVPITGFANSIVAPAMEHKTEGYIMGVGAKLFSLAGPVLVYGISASILVGLVCLYLGGGAS